MSKRKPLVIAVVFGFLVTWELALEVAISGRVNNPGLVANALVFLIAPVLVPRWRDRDFRRLDAQSQMTVNRTMRTGVPSGDPTLDAMATRRLERTVQSAQGSQIFVPVFGVAFAIVLIVAAIRGSALWLLCLTWLLLLVPMHNNVKSQRDAGRRLVMLRQLMS